MEKLLANKYKTICQKCERSFCYPLFESSFYNFEAYQEANTGIYVRLDIDACHYRSISHKEALLEAEQYLLDRVNTFKWLKLPIKLLCPNCNEITNGPDQDKYYQSIGEYEVEAICIPI